MPDDTIELPIQVPTAPEGFCSSLTDDWIQQLLNLFGQSVALLNTGAGAGTITLKQESQPTAEQRNFLWFRPSTGRTYYWSAGAWISPHEYAPSDPVASMWVEATPNQIWAFDGGDGTDPSSNTPTTNNGAMWVIDTNYAGRSPMGAGAIPNANPSKTLSIGENYGEGAHTQTVLEMPAHTHPAAEDFDDFAGFVSVGQPSSFEIEGGTEVERMERTGATGGGEAMPVIHPVRGMYRIVRSARANFVAS